MAKLQKENYMYTHEFRLSSNYRKVNRIHVFKPSSETLKYLNNNLKKQQGFYIIQFSNGAKFGVSSNISRRLRSYSSPWCQPIEEIIIIYSNILIDLSAVVEFDLKGKLCRLIQKIDYSTEFIEGYRIRMIENIARISFEKYADRNLVKAKQDLLCERTKKSSIDNVALINYL